MHRLVRPPSPSRSSAACAVAPALAASVPKRGYYIDPKLQTYIITTKDVTAIKSFQTACVNSDSGQNGSFIVSRKITLKSDGGFSYTGNAKIYNGDPKPKHRQGQDHRDVQQRQVQGHGDVPEGATRCDAANFSAKYYGVNPRG